jgi:hypothetical protein
LEAIGPAGRKGPFLRTLGLQNHEGHGGMAMKKRGKPRGPWDSVIEIPAGTFKKNHYQEIAEKFKITPTETLIKKIIDAQNLYYAGIRNINEAPRMKEVCATMRMLIKASKKWIENLRRIDDRTLEKLQAVCPTDGHKEIFTDMKNDRLLIWDRIDESLNDAQIIRGCAERALSVWDTYKAQRNTGAPFDFPFNSYICQLNIIFEKATGKKRKVTFLDRSDDEFKGEYTGPFLEFAWTCFNLIPGRPRLTKYAFGTRIRRALKTPIKFYPA